MHHPPPAPASAKGAGCHKIIVIGCSAGGPEALRVILTHLPKSYPIPILVVQHLHPLDEGRFAENLAKTIKLEVLEAQDKQPILPGRLYVAPANYHLLVERSGRIALNIDDRVNSSRPSIDVTFDSVARAYGEAANCVVLTGANFDGTAGALAVRMRGGLVIAQDPVTAVSPAMPKSVVDAGAANLVLPLERIAEFLQNAEHLPEGS